jgi:hypothetical protein
MNKAGCIHRRSLKNNNKPVKTMNEQKTILETTMKKWKGDIEQIDDILVMGVRF